LLHNDSIEKNFIYLVALSLVLHLLLAAIFASLPEQQRPLSPEPIMVDLQDLPAAKPQVTSPDDVNRLDEQRRRVPREMAPRGVDGLDRLVPRLPVVPPSQPALPKPSVKPVVPGDVPLREAPLRRGEGLLKPTLQQPQVQALNRLQPSSERMAKLEESYRQKFRDEVAEGDAYFLNTNASMLASFSRRLDTAIYSVWEFPQEAARLGIDGVTVMWVTFDRNGEVESYKLLESSGSKLLDREVERVIKKLGVLGKLPKEFKGEHLNYVMFFEYKLGGVMQVK
jgi:periplasmic protein TonB